MGIPLKGESELVRALHYFLYKRRSYIDKNTLQAKPKSPKGNKFERDPYHLKVFIIHDPIRDKDFSQWISESFRILDRASGNHLIFYSSSGRMDTVMEKRMQQDPHYRERVIGWKDNRQNSRYEDKVDEFLSSVESISRKLGIYYNLFEKSPILLISYDDNEVNGETHFVSCRTSRELLLGQINILGEIADSADHCARSSNEVYDEIESRLESIRVDVLDRTIIEAEDMLCLMRFASGRANRYQALRAAEYISQLERKIVELCSSSAESEGDYEINSSIKSIIMDLNIALQSAANTNDGEISASEFSCYSEEVRREISLSVMAAQGAKRIKELRGEVSFTAPLLGLAVLIEREFNSAAVHYIRASVGVEIPKKYMLFDELKGEAKLNHPKLNKKIHNIDFNKQDRNGRQDEDGNILWDPPAISISKKFFLDFINLSNEDYPHTEDIYHIKDIIDSTMNNDWDNCIELRNLAAHAIKSIDDTMYIQMESFALSVFKVGGLFDKLNSIRKSLGIK